MIKHFLNVVFHPVEFMESHGFVQAAWFPLLIVTVGLILLRMTLVPEMRKEYSSPEYKKWYMERQSVTEEQAGKDIEKMYQIAPIMSFFESPVMVVVGAAGIALFLSLIGRFGYRQTLDEKGQRIGFIQVFHMTAWASAVSIFPIIVQAGMKYFELGTGLPTNVAFYLPKEAEGTYLYNILQTMDLFLIWQVLLLGLGMAALYGVSKQRAISSVGTLFVILAIFNAMALTLTVAK